MYVVTYALEGQQQSSVARGAVLGVGWGHLKDRASYWGQQRLQAANIKKGIPFRQIVKPKLRWRGALKSGLVGAGLGLVLGYSEDQQPSALRRWGHRALVGAGVVGGGVLGAKLLYSPYLGGRALRRGESIAGKVLSRPTEAYSPLELLGTAIGKDPYSLPKKVRAMTSPGSLLRRGVDAVERIQVRPGRHFSVGMPGGKMVWEKGDSVQGLTPKTDLWKTGGRKTVRVHGEFPIRTIGDRVALRQRIEKAGMNGKADDFNFCGNNCEHNARAIAGLKRKSDQIRGVLGGAAIGSVATGGAAEVMTHPRRRAR